MSKIRHGKKKKKGDGGTAKGDGAHSTVEALAELRKKQAEELLQMVREAWAPDGEKDEPGRDE